MTTRAMPGLVHQDFISESWPGPFAHAATLAETRSGLVLAFFGGSREEGNAELFIFVSQLVGGTWSGFAAVADGTQAAGQRQPVWNPVLFQPRNGPLLLFYKAGPGPDSWWGERCSSEDGGLTWSEPRRLSDGLVGPAKNKPVQLQTGEIIAPASTERPEVGWRVYFERSSDGGTTWERTPYVESEADVRAIQPTILIARDGALQALVRTASGRLFRTASHDRGVVWSPLVQTSLPNPNSGIDAVTLHDGRHLLVYNDSADERTRTPLSLALSEDGQAWKRAGVLEGAPLSWPEQFSYPSVIQARDGLVHIAYTWHRRKIKHAVIDPGQLRAVAMAT